MTKDHHTWHYGLMAERWARGIHEVPELPFYLQEIERSGQPVLDLACGTGRVLLPLLREGVDIDGCDFSGDMLAYCRESAAAEGFSPLLKEHPMDSFRMPRRYRTIYICDSFGLAGTRQDDQLALRRCWEHLEPGGVLLLNIQAEFNLPEAWMMWLPDGRESLPEPWPEEASRRELDDGSISLAYFRITAFNPLEQTYTREVRLEKRVEGTLIAEEKYTLQGTVYFKNELIGMLTAAGFQDIQVFGEYEHEPAAPEDIELVFRAEK